MQDVFGSDSFLKKNQDKEEREVCDTPKEKEHKKEITKFRQINISPQKIVHVCIVHCNFDNDKKIVMMIFCLCSKMPNMVELDTCKYLEYIERD